MNTIKKIIEIKNPVIVDVRNTWEFDEEHVTNAINVPLHELPSRINELKKINKPFIFYCRSGNRSGAAVNILKQSGIMDVHNGGGIFDLKNIIEN